MSFVQINPRYRDLLEALRLRTADQFLALPGVVVSGHPDRHVMRAALGSLPVFLKREHRVRWRDRVAGWFAGFGFVTKSQREAMTLRALEQAGVGCPEWIACGEDGRGRAFLLLRALQDAVELRRFLHERRGRRELHKVARRLGQAVARLHAAGFDHPDLYSKHVFVSGYGEAVFFLDLQRSRRGPVGQRQRIRDLAALDATLGKSLASHSDRWAFWRAYIQELPAPRLPFDTKCLARSIRRQSAKLQRKRHIREARQVPCAGSQELIWLDGEALCITPAFLDELRGDIPDWLRLDRAPPRWETACRGVPLPNGRHGLLVRSCRRGLLRWLWNAFRRRPLTTPEARQAGLLFRRERQGQPAPRLLAFGQRRLRPWQTESFLLTEEPALDDGRAP